MEILNIPKIGSLVKITKYIYGEKNIVIYDVVTEMKYFKIGNEELPIAFYTTFNNKIPLPFEGINFSYTIVSL